MPHALLVGAFGQGNPGDEALCAAFHHALRGADVTIASRAPALSAARHHATVVPPSPASVARALGRADLVVIGGGTVFKQLHPSTRRPRNALLRSTAALVGAARARGVEVALVGVGAAPLAGSEARALARWIVRASSLLVLRDEESAAVLTEAGAATPFRIGADPAWTLLRPPEPRRAVPADGAGPITVAVSHLAGDRTFAGRLGAALRPFAADRPIHLQPWQTDRAQHDRAFAATVRDHVGGGAEIVPPPADLEAAVAGARRSRLVLALRFHAIVAAGAAGATTLAIAHEPKLGGLARRLGQPSVPPHATTEVLHRAVAEALTHPPPPAGSVAAEITRAADGFTLLRLLLDQGTAVPAEIHSPPLSTGAGWW